ncbi:lipopolysaccharide kinase InaA family protein [Akkermansiaceae bacterium]|nr:lipopolysaccharide kinase InaA family protein [Akkermansiaceae bacterium]
MNDQSMSQEPLAQRSLKHRGYRLRSTLDEATARQLLDDIIEKSYSVQKLFKDSRSTYAAHLQVGKESLFYKIPRARLRRTWEKLITVIRDSESFRTFDNLQLMHQLGFKAPAPLLAGEKRRNGFVVDSFCCYRFEEGKGAGANDAQQVTSELLRLHEKGYLRTDAKATNFLITEEGVSFIDFRLKKTLLFPKLKKQMELARLARVYPESLAHIPENIRTSTSFKLATWLERKNIEFKAARRRVKRTFKSK